jgi:hypothetical protein
MPSVSFDRRRLKASPTPRSERAELDSGNEGSESIEDPWRRLSRRRSIVRDRMKLRWAPCPNRPPGLMASIRTIRVR